MAALLGSLPSHRAYEQLHCYGIAAAPWTALMVPARHDDLSSRLAMRRLTCPRMLDCIVRCLACISHSSTHAAPAAAASRARRHLSRCCRARRLWRTSRRWRPRRATAPCPATWWTPSLRSCTPTTSASAPCCSSSPPPLCPPLLPVASGDLLNGTAVGRKVACSSCSAAGVPPGRRGSAGHQQAPREKCRPLGASAGS
jgi:hypothetical protein